MNVWRGLRFAFEQPPFLVGIVGAGGKSTLLYRLSEAAAAARFRVLVTTTTRWWIDQWHRFPKAVSAASLAEFRSVANTVPPGTTVAVVRGLDHREGKAIGVPPNWVDAVHSAVDVILVEADGARQRPLKAPAAHEPVLPDRCTHVITVAGWQGVGRPLDERWVHRPDLFARASGLHPGDVISPEALVRVLTHPEGGLKATPPQARVRAVINQVDTLAQLEKARGLAAPILQSRRVESVTFAALQRPDPVWETHVLVAAVVLAAGAGVRFGGAKQVATWKGRPLIAHVLDAAAHAAVDAILVVLGAYADQVRAAVMDWHREHPGANVRLVLNPHWQEGQSTSVRAALAHLGDVGAAVFLLADQPRVSSALVNALITTHRRTLALAVVPRYGGRAGSPVLFDARAFPELNRLRGDVGGRAVWQAHEAEVAWLDWPDQEAARDVDRPSDLESL